jgi:hypothetical protein
VPFPPYPAVPNPATWANGPILTSSLRNDVTNAVNFLANRPLFLGQNTLGSVVTPSANLAVSLNSELVDTWNGHLTTAAAYFCQAPGWYLAEVSMPYNYTGGQALFYGGFSGLSGGVSFTSVGELQQMGSGHNPQPQACDLILQTVTGPPGGSGDGIEPIAAQFTGGNVNLQSTTAVSPYMSVRWVAAASGTASLPVPANPAWPVPTAYITAAFLNANIRDTIRFLAYPPVYRAHYTAGSATLPTQSFPAGTVVPLTTIDVDNYSGGTTGTSASYTAPVAGVYFCYGQTNLAAPSNQLNVCAGLSVNGGTTQWGTSAFSLTNANGNGMCVRKRLRLNAGDTVQFISSQGSPGAIAYNTVANNQTRFLAVWESA